MEEVILHSSLGNNGKNYQAYLTSTFIAWCIEQKEPSSKPPDVFHDCIPLQEIFAVTFEAESEKKKKERSNNFELAARNRFAIHSIIRCKNHHWRNRKIIFCCQDSALCTAWVDAVSNLLKDFNRPKKLLIFVNPVGGKKQARYIFQEKVAPLLAIAGIHQEVVVTERANHAYDYLITANLDHVDGIVAVGGDGMFSEILNGALAHEKSGNSPLKVKLGLIPAGSTDTVVFCTTGTNDPISSTLHIIIGDELRIDVCSVWHDSKLLKHSVSLMGYGFFGEVVRESEHLRWMGPRRYDIAGFRNFMANRSYAGEINYLPAPASHGNPRHGQICMAGCRRCSEDPTTDDCPDGNDGWKTIRGKFISVIGANITCKCAKSLNGISPNAHLGDGYFDLILIRKTSRLQYLRHMLRIANRGDLFAFDFIEVFRVKEFKFRPLLTGETHVTAKSEHENTETENLNEELILGDVPKRQPLRTRARNEESVWNIDGELIEEPNLHIKVHRKLVSIFARGIEEMEEITSCRTC